MGLILPRWGVILPRMQPPNPVLYSAITHPFLACVHKTPPNTPFLGLNFKVGKMNYRLGNLDPIWANCLKSGQTFSRRGQKKFIHIVLNVITKLSNKLSLELAR